MRTILRYQRQGHKNWPKYWLVVQGSYKNLRGKYVEKLGFWIPVGNKKEKFDRSLIMNKNRIRYWIGEGAEIAPKAYKHLSYFGLTNPPWIQWGRKTIEYGTNSDYGLRKKVFKDYIDPHRNNVFIKKMRQAEIENIILRRVKIRERLMQEFENKTNKEVLAKLLTEDDNNPDDEDVMIRSVKFWYLKNEYEKIENNLFIQNPAKKEMLFKKLNSIAEKGFLSKEEIGYDNPLFAIFSREKNLAINPHADAIFQDIKKDLELKEYEIEGEVDLETILLKRRAQKMSKVPKVVEEFNELAEPIGKEEFYEELKKLNPDSTESYIQEITTETYNNAFIRNKYVTRLDLINFKVKDEESEFNISDPRFITKLNEEIQNEDIDNMVIPKVYPLTPLPNFEEYDPEDYYSLKEDISNPIRPTFTKEDQWFDIPKNRYKMNEGEQLIFSKKIMEESLRRRTKPIKLDPSDKFYHVKPFERIGKKEEKDLSRKEKDLYKNYTEKIIKDKPFEPKVWVKGRRPKQIKTNRVPLAIKEMTSQEEFSDDEEDGNFFALR